MNLADMASAPLVRGLIQGHPGAGKTGCLASLANAGFKLRILDFDGNPEPLSNYVDQAARANVDIISFEDGIADSGSFLHNPKPTAFARALAIMTHGWRYEHPNGPITDEKTGKRMVDLGNPGDWTDDTVVVLDGITGAGDAAYARAQHVTNKTPLNTTDRVWKLAQDELLQFTKKLTSQANRFHFLAISHLTMIGPKDIRKEDDDVTKEIKEQVASLVKTRWYPSALGWKQPQRYAGEFPMAITAEVNRRGKRVLTYTPRDDLDMKLPVRDLAALGELPVETGLLKIFEAYGVVPPNKRSRSTTKET